MFFTPNNFKTIFSKLRKPPKLQNSPEPLVSEPDAPRDTTHNLKNRHLPSFWGGGRRGLPKVIVVDAGHHFVFRDARVFNRTFREMVLAPIMQLDASKRTSVIFLLYNLSPTS